jgi:hypothetical protein
LLSSFGGQVIKVVEQYRGCGQVEVRGGRRQKQGREASGIYSVETQGSPLLVGR